MNPPVLGHRIRLPTQLVDYPQHAAQFLLDRRYRFHWTGDLAGYVQNIGIRGRQL
jgi:hypothetical protein